MPNRNYQNGRAKEQRIVNKLKAQGYIAARSAGSKSPIDVWSVNPKTKLVKLIQSKIGYLSPKQKEEINKLKELNGLYLVEFELWD